ncbi:MAG: DUF2271 domain-containing protein [Burkholderiales bacterium]|jgi:hypothetical protein|nr:DUF2271 domain-containing protein [Burkholderiales bacterium]
MLIRTSLALTTAVVAVPAWSAEATLKIQLPRLDLAEYHKPYLAAWIEKASDQSFAGNIALWYDVNKRNDGGAKWLKDMRSWWRKSGHDGPAVDGVTGATRTAGEHAINLLDARAVAALPPGRYEVVVEAARENGGREVLRVPFEWPLQKAQSAKAQGQGELGSVAIDARP